MTLGLLIHTRVNRQKTSENNWSTPNRSPDPLWIVAAIFIHTGTNGTWVISFGQESNA